MEADGVTSATHKNHGKTTSTGSRQFVQLAVQPAIATSNTHSSWAGRFKDRELALTSAQVLQPLVGFCWPNLGITSRVRHTTNNGDGGNAPSQQLVLWCACQLPATASSAESADRQVLEGQSVRTLGDDNAEQRPNSDNASNDTTATTMMAATTMRERRQTSNRHDEKGTTKRRSDERRTNNEQRTTKRRSDEATKRRSDEATNERSDERTMRRTTKRRSDEATNNEQRTTNNEQRTTNNEQRTNEATNNEATNERRSTTTHLPPPPPPSIHSLFPTPGHLAVTTNTH